jgi:hypothetical protein
MSGVYSPGDLPVRTLIDRCHHLSIAGDAIMGNVSVICENVQSRTWSAFITLAWCFEYMFARDVDGLARVYDESLILAIEVY